MELFDSALFNFKKTPVNETSRALNCNMPFFFEKKFFGSQEVDSYRRR